MSVIIRTEMTTTGSKSAEPKCKHRWFRLSRRKFIVLTLLFFLSGIAIGLWSIGLPLSWKAHYDTARYNQIRTAIEADPQHLLGKSLDEVTKELRLEGVPWDDFGFQELYSATHIFHFRGFALYVHLQFLPAGTTPNTIRLSDWADLKRPGALWLADWKPFVKIDGISDGKERMNQYVKEFNERLEREGAY